jgi:hypothetical protein
MSDSWFFSDGCARITAGYPDRLLPTMEWLVLVTEQDGLARLRDRRCLHRASSRCIGELTIFLRRVTAGTANRADPS